MWFEKFKGTACSSRYEVMNKLNVYSIEIVIKRLNFSSFMGT